MNPETETGGVIAAAGAIVTALWLALRALGAESRADLKASLKKAEDRADAADARALGWERRYVQLANEIKAAASRRHSFPPGREEMPTLDAILDLRYGDPVRARQDAIDAELVSGLNDLRSGRPGPPSLPLTGVTPDQRKRPR